MSQVDCHRLFLTVHIPKLAQTWNDVLKVKAEQQETVQFILRAVVQNTVFTGSGTLEILMLDSFTPREAEMISVCGKHSNTHLFSQSADEEPESFSYWDLLLYCCLMSTCLTKEGTNLNIGGKFLGILYNIPNTL